MEPRSSLSKVPLDVLVCVVDDDASVRRSLLRLFHSARLAAETFASGQAYLERPVHDGPCCLVLDFLMPQVNGLQLQQALASRRVPIIFLSGNSNVPTCVEAMKAGAVDFLTKPIDDTALLAAVDHALTRSAQERAKAAERAAIIARIDTLTAREFEVMERVIAGLLNKQIAAELGAAEKTVKIHRGRVMEKTGVTSVADLVRVAQIAGIKPRPDARPFWSGEDRVMSSGRARRMW